MTTSASPRHARPVVINLEDTVTIHTPGEATVRLLTTPRDTDAAITARLSFGVVGSRPEEPLGATRVRIDPDRLNDALQARFDRFAAGGARHRAPEPSLFARWFGHGRKDGA